ncbi:MAG: hypothetical protein EOM66_02765 [Clostridia bacterium]|nr:hypothetical protein [Clostridia bacterium]
MRLPAGIGAAWRSVAARAGIWRGDSMALWSLLLGLVLSFAGDGAQRLSPFCAAAAAGAWMAGYAPWPALLGGMAGSLFTAQFAALAVAGAYGLLGMLWLLWRGSAERPDKLLLLACAHLICLPFFYFDTVDTCMVGLAQASLSLLCAPLLQRAAEALSGLGRRRSLSEEELCSLCALFAMLSMGGMAVGYQGVGLGGILASFGAVCAAGTVGLPAVAVAALLGAGALLGGASLPFVGCLALCTLCAAFLWRHKWAMVSLFLATAALCSFYVQGGESMLLYAGLGCGGYLLLPNAVTRLLRRSARPRGQGESQRQLAQFRRQVLDAARVLGSVAEVLEVSGQSQAERFAGRQLRGIGCALAGLTQPREGPLPINFSLSLGAAACPKAGSSQTGDSMALRELCNQHLLLLSDGMGSGATAHRESAAAVALLGDLLSIGVEETAALECVNRLLMLKCQDDMYATLDLLLFDPATAKARFFKQGAPPSYVLRGGRVHTIHAETLPVGILTEAAPATPLETVLLRGDAVVMMTDGLADGLGQALFAAIIERVGGANTAQDAAEALLALADEQGRLDDMSVIVARIN